MVHGEGVKLTTHHHWLVPVDLVDLEKVLADVQEE